MSACWASGIPSPPMACRSTSSPRRSNACVWPMTFENRSLLTCVEQARQAFSIDDERRTFFPIRWDETAETRTPDADGSPRLLAGVVRRLALQCRRRLSRRPACPHAALLDDRRGGSKRTASSSRSRSPTTGTIASESGRIYDFALGDRHLLSLPSACRGAADGRRDRPGRPLERVHAHAWRRRRIRSDRLAKRGGDPAADRRTARLRRRPAGAAARLSEAQETGRSRPSAHAARAEAQPGGAEQGARGRLRRRGTAPVAGRARGARRPA